MSSLARLRIAARLLVALGAVFGPPPYAAAAPCVARSGERTTGLVELYTADDCASCARADSWLAGLGGRFSADQVVPVTLHVDYRDYLGSRKPDAQRRVWRRQRTLSLLQRMALVYTPHVLLQGREFPAWDSGSFETAVGRINAQPARAHLTVEIRSVRRGELKAMVEAEVAGPVQRREAVLYVAAVHSRSTYEHRVLEWQGPLLPGPDGHFAAERSLALLPGATAGSSGVAAFVQNSRTGEVLQAVLLSACSP